MEPTLMQKIKDALSKFEYDAIQSGQSIVLSAQIGPLCGNLTLTVGDDRRLHYLIGFDSSAVGKL